MRRGKHKCRQCGSEMKKVESDILKCKKCGYRKPWSYVEGKIGYSH